jgi:hypothetical protein
MKTGAWLRRAVAVFGVAALGVAGVAVLRADTGGAPGRAARLSDVEGQVQLTQGGGVLADHALINTPLFEGTQVATGDDGRAEIQFDDGSVARIPPDSSLTLTVLKQGGDTEVSLDSGMGYFELQDGSQGNPVRVRFGSNVVTASGFTVFRVKLDNGPGELAVFSGNAHLDGTNGASLDLHGGESLALSDFNLTEAIEPDSWDAWNSDRDQAETTAEAGSTPATDNLPNSNNPAWGDLNSNGTWYDVPDQGYVWSPYEASNSGFDPYGSGYWMWTPGYGYVWVSGYPWGYMPFQCGAWNWYNSFGWGWAPGMCNTWWGGGVWGFNVGSMPVWYRLPLRPHPPRPINPRPVEGHNRPIGIRPLAPVIAVNRREVSGAPVLPPREPGHPVQIGGVVAQPLRPVAPRTAGGPVMGFHHVNPVSTRPYNGQPTSVVNPGSAFGSTGTARPIYTPARPGYQPAPGYGGAPVYAPAPGYGTRQPGYMPVPQPGAGRPPVGFSAPRPSPGTYRPPPSAPRPAPSGGGHPAGGGGGAHPSGGAAHK